MTLSFNLPPGVALGDALNEIEKVKRDIGLPASVQGSFQGTAKAFQETMIDFQVALAGSPAYDIVSLLEDARRDVSAPLAAAMTKRYLEQARASGVNVDPERFSATAALLAAQRNAKIIGIFARLAKRDNKPRYLAHLPRVWRYMSDE